MQTTNQSVSPLAAALNNTTRTRIGDPVRGSFSISIATDDAHEANSLAATLAGLGATFQANFRRHHTGRPEKVFLAIYDLESQRHLHSALEAELHPRRSEALDLLVRARGPVPEDVLRRIDATIRLGKSYEYVTSQMLKGGLVDGMGKGWTPKKVKKIHREYKYQQQTGARAQADRSG
jgi:hypothetical protein